MRRPSVTRLGRVAVLALPSVIVLAATGVTTGVAVAVQEQSIRASVVDQVSGVASSLAALPEVRAMVASVVDSGAPGALADADGLASATASLQPIASLVEGASGVSYVVVTDDEGVRITHPDPSERGELVETTIAPVLAGERFVGTETGPSGPTLRAKVPVTDDAGRVTGVVAVGVLESTIAADRARAFGALLPWSTGALLVATLASVLLSIGIARRLRRADAVDAESRQVRRTTDALREQAHEFGTRLHVVRGLVAQGDGPDALAYIDAVAPGLTSGGGAGSPRRGAVATATIEAVRSEVDAHGATLELRVADDVVLDDEVLLVIANLCRNAAEAGATRVRCTTGSRGTVGGCDAVAITVEDDGPGIDPADAHRVFGHGWSSKTDDTGLGRGVGLAVVRRTATDRGGSVVVGRSASLGGARIDVEMAVAP
ncbi:MULTISPECIES: ATP-binding protein [Curtobacterium]|uniref:sensor histidine kinase n=1 Tax=Curtobacterium flaccumfaciens TaxID=2035 RepID=UPI003EE4DABC